jgi:TonB family protein
VEATAKNKWTAGTLTIVIHAALILLLMFSVLGMPDPPLTSGEGMVVNLGYVDEASGEIQPMSEVTTENPVVENIQATARPEENEQFLTQENEISEAVKIKENKNPVKENTEVKNTNVVETPKKTEPEKTVNPNALYKGKNNNSTSQGTVEGQGDQGSRDGDPFSKDYGNAGSGNKPGTGGGIGYNLKGRSVRHLPAPSTNLAEEGKVVVEITVDKDGNVIKAKPGVKGSTTTSSQLLNLARSAAMQAKFNPNPNADVQVGTITYIFVFSSK